MLEGLAMADVGIFYDHLVYFGSILRPFGIFFPVLVCCTKKNLVTLFETYFVDGLALDFPFQLPATNCGLTTRAAI
jgi:hypothetical protein